MGVIVSIQENNQRWTLHLDDSSGLNIEIMCPRPREFTRLGDQVSSVLAKDDPLWNMGHTVNGYDIDMGRIQLGDVIKAKGGVGEFRNERQLLLERYSTRHALCGFLYFV